MSTNSAIASGSPMQDLPSTSEIPVEVTNSAMEAQRVYYENEERRAKERHLWNKEKHLWEKNLALLQLQILKYELEAKKKELNEYN